MCNAWMVGTVLNNEINGRHLCVYDQKGLNFKNYILVITWAYLILGLLYTCFYYYI